jgi:hypothetical protein
MGHLAKNWCGKKNGRIAGHLPIAGIITEALRNPDMVWI